MNNIAVLKNKKLIISKHNLMMYLLFMCSSINRPAFCVWLLIIPVISVLKYGKTGAVESLVFIQMRAVLSNKIAAPISGAASYIKWAVVFALSFYLIICADKSKLREIKSIVRAVSVFAFVSIISAWITSSYPMTATAKVLSYSIPFIGILIGVYDTENVNWIEKITWFLGFLIVFSCFFLGTQLGYSSRAPLFQGVFYHPNTCGVMISMFVTGFLYINKKMNLKAWIVVCLSAVILYQTKSRTGMFSLVFILVIFLFLQKIPLGKKLIMIFLVFIGGLIFLFLDDSLIDAISAFIFKGHKGNLLFSRGGQITKNMYRFKTHPLFGTGFNVPFKEGARSFSFSFEERTENGNLILALLGDVGLLGFVLFIVAYLKIFRAGDISMPILFLNPIITSMAEMAFFSTNGYGIILYFFIAIHLAEGLKARQVGEGTIENK